jgi:putative Mg2+ transporter-C (MgtC) family protein
VSLYGYTARAREIPIGSALTGGKTGVFCPESRENRAVQPCWRQHGMRVVCGPLLRRDRRRLSHRLAPFAAGPRSRPILRVTSLVSGGPNIVFQAELWEWAWTLALAAGIGALIGGERESRGRPAGVRTQALVALAAALMTMSGKVGFVGVGTDLSRVASQVVTGIGFIGAGVILKHRGTVTGLTTAATLFLSAGLGIAIGAGLIAPALITTVIALIVIYGLRLVRPVLRRNITQVLHVDYVQGHGTFGPLIRAVQDQGGSIQDLRVEDDVGSTGEPMRHVTIHVLTSRETDLESRMQPFLARPEVEDLRVLAG